MEAENADASEREDEGGLPEGAAVQRRKVHPGNLQSAAASQVAVEMCESVVIYLR